MLFDVLNSCKKHDAKPAKCALSAANTNVKTLVTLKEWVGTWTFVDARAQSAKKCHQGLLTSLQNIKSLSCELMTDDGFAFVCTSRFNQDCIENFFACLRSKQGWTENPTPTQFQTAFRSAVILSSLDSCTSGKNCINDDDFELLKHDDFSTSVEQQEESVAVVHDAGHLVEAGDDEVSVWCEMSNEILHSDICYEQGVLECFTEAEESLVCYLAGWLARKCGICAKCQEVLSKQLGDHSYCCRPMDIFAKCKRFVGIASVGLVEPCDVLVVAVHTRKPCCRNETARCRKCSFPLKFANNIHYKYKKD